MQDLGKLGATQGPPIELHWSFWDGMLPIFAALLPWVVAGLVIYFVLIRKRRENSAAAPPPLPGR